MSSDDFNKYEFTPEEFEDYKIGYEKNWENAIKIGSVSWEELKSAKEREDKEFDEAVDRIEERLVESKKPVGKPFEHKNKKRIYLKLEEVNEELENMSEEEITKLNKKIKKDIQLEEAHLRIKDEIQNMMIVENEGVNKTLRKANSIAITVDETELLIEKISGKESKIGKNDFCVLEISKDDLGHEYEVVYEVVNGLENAISLCGRLNKNNDDDNAYYEVQYVDPDNLWLW